VSGRGGSSRHRARELALQALYAIDLGLRRPPRGGAPVHNVELDAPSTEMEKTLAAAALTDSTGTAGQDGTSAVRSAKGEIEEGAAREVFDAIAENFEAPPGARDAAWELVSCVCAHSALLDERIAARARNWRVSRMAAVDRNILRLGTYELGHTRTPPAVVMDEAVELARRYGTDASPAFVNGILDGLAGDLRPDANHAGGTR